MINISVIVPVYNGENYIGKCLDSILNQTEKDIEIICINDGSTDNSFDVLLEYQKKDNRITVINQHNHGVSFSRNEGMRISRGDYIAFVDCDDRLDIKMLEIMHRNIRNSGADVVICSANVICNKQTKETDNIFRQLSVTSSDTSKINDSYRLESKNGLMPFVWNKLYRKQFLTDNSILFPENVSLGEDSVFLIQLYKCCPTVTFVSDRLYNYSYMTDNSATDTMLKKAPGRLNEHLKTVKAAVETYRDRKYVFDAPLASWIREQLLYDYLLTDVNNEKKALSSLLDFLSEEERKTLFLDGYISSFMLEYSSELGRVLNLNYYRLKKHILNWR